VLFLVPGASIARNGQTHVLKQHDPVQASDIITTDATGRVRLLFNDDSTVDMGSNTSLNLRDFADSGAKPVFNVHLLQGLVRVVTGRIVEQNPSGFTVTTPEATIGIRGTIISVRARDGVSTVYVENTTRAVYVNGVNVPGGQKITIPSDPVRPELIRPLDRKELSRELAFWGGAGVAVAAPEPSGQTGRPEEQPLIGTQHLVENTNLIPPNSPLADISLPTQALGDSLTTPNLMAFVSGNLWSTAYTNTFTGSFSFNADLSSGVISNGTITGSGIASGGGPYTGNFNVNYVGGTGTVTSGMYPVAGVHGFSNGGGTTAAFAAPAMLANSFLKTPVDLRTVPNGGPVTPFDYGFDNGAAFTPDYGQGSGTLTK
jgi:hypothetical protein